MINADKLESIAFDVFIDNMRSTREERELQEMEAADAELMERITQDKKSYPTPELQMENLGFLLDDED